MWLLIHVEVKVNPNYIKGHRSSFFMRRKHISVICHLWWPQPQFSVTLQRRHNKLDGVSNHRRLKCLFNRLFKCRSKKISMLCLTDLCAGNSPVTDELPALLLTAHVLQLPAWASMVMIRICRISLMYSVLAVSWNRVIFQIFAGKHSSWDNCHLLNKIIQGRCKCRSSYFQSIQTVDKMCIKVTLRGKHEAFGYHWFVGSFFNTRQAVEQNLIHTISSENI